MSVPVHFLHDRLRALREKGLFRSLPRTENCIDFCSNDYLGFARSSDLRSEIDRAYASLREFNHGSTGSRLVSGNTAYAEELETFIAHVHGSEAGLIFNSGYDANMGLLSALLKDEGTLIYDEWVHASMHDGMRLSKASALPFRHNNLEHLEKRLEQAEGLTFVAVESIYSMDGDTAHLEEILRLCDKRGAHLIVDEAHATGVIGPQGKGMVAQMGLEGRVFARVHTFGKALGCHGAIVLGTQELRDFLTNTSRPFIYSTALPLHSLVSIHTAYAFLALSDPLREALHRHIALFRKLVENKNWTVLKSSSPIQGIIVSGNKEVVEVAQALQSSGFHVMPIRSPTVRRGTERLRVCLHATHTEEQIRKLLDLLGNLL